MKIRVKKLHEDAIVPKYHHSGDSGFDLHALTDTTIAPGETKLVDTGLAFDVGLGYELQVRPRSGLSLKTPLRVSNSPGTVDASFRGSVCVIMTNTASPIYQGKLFSLEKDPALAKATSITIKKGDRIAQGIVCPVAQADIEVVDYLEETERGSGAFGSTGV